MEIVIHNLSNILAYIDDFLSHTKDHGKHFEVLDELFTRLRKHGLKINQPKSFFGATEVSYLGFKLTPDGIKPGVDKLKAVAAVKPPNNITKVRAFLGLCNFYRGNVRNFAQMAAPLNLLTTNTCEWKGGPLPTDTEKAFKELKSVLISEPVVHYPNPNLPYALIIEACLADYLTQVATVQFWPRSSPTESSKSSAMPAGSSSVTRRIMNPFYWKSQLPAGEGTIMMSISKENTLRFTRTPSQ
jgi:hypothetical protein